jgi:hypothetical protein
MEIPIVVEPVGENAFRASSGRLWGIQIEAPTREEAVEKLPSVVSRAGNPAVPATEGPWRGVRHTDPRIAARTIENGGTLVTHNLRGFRSVPDPRVADWYL